MVFLVLPVLQELQLQSEQVGTLLCLELHPCSNFYCNSAGDVIRLDGSCGTVTRITESDV